jgi:glycosyltransferase involved in cell wall biosynthesis
LHVDPAEKETEGLNMMKPCILIPAYKPDHHMLEVIRDLFARDFDRILVVDDGSGDAYAPVFAEAEALGCRMVRHAVNMGKGRALKTGFNDAINAGYADQGVITADADGQHTPQDIEKIAVMMAAKPDALVLGVRLFVGNVPLRNRIGNGITRFVFTLINGDKVQDTQTGLRGIPLQHMPLLLTLAGERYEYEMNMLLVARPNGIRMEQVPIETVYIEGNKHSHYKVLLDSARVYGKLLSFIASSMIAAFLDFGLFVLLHNLLPTKLMVSVVVARVCSSFVNYLINHNLVFRAKGGMARSAIRYYTLATVIMMSSYLLIRLFVDVFAINTYLAKVIADIILYFVSFVVQREFVYRTGSQRRESAR